MAKLVIAPSAEDDLKRIVDYIALDLCNPEAAESFLDELDAVYDSLESMPGSFPYCKDGYLRANEYHQAGIKDYLMIFRIDDGGRYRSNTSFLSRQSGLPGESSI